MPDSLAFQVGKFTFQVAPDRLYTPEGLWWMAAGSAVRVGLSDFLQQRSGDMAFVEIPAAGTALAAGGELASVETIKVTLNLTTPLAVTVARVNPVMETAPETINLDPYGAGWLCEVEGMDWEAAKKQLLKPEVYLDQTRREAESEANQNGG